MKTLESFVGNTPLVRLQRIPYAAGVDNTRRNNVILAKLEGNNPAGSVKDRPALSMIARAEARGTIKPGDTLIEVAPVAGGCGLGVIEGWRGEVLVGVQFDSDGKFARVHPHDPSWQAWPALEHAVMKDIVPDFPLINKSFNLSYSGADL